MESVEAGRVDLFWRAVQTAAARLLEDGYRIRTDQYLLITSRDAVLSLGPLWAELAASYRLEQWEGEIERHLLTCTRLIEQVADVGVDHHAVAEPTFRLRLAQHTPRSVAFDLGAGWGLAMVIDLGIGLVPITDAHVDRWQAGSPPNSTMTALELLQSARQTTIEQALPHLTAARVGPELTLLSAGSHTAGCLLDLDRLASAVDVNPTLALPLSPSVVAFGGSSKPTANHDLLPMAQALATLGDELDSLREWLNVPVWQFHSPGRLGIFEV